jgi:CheY-like chemotaxis protein
MTLVPPRTLVLVVDDDVDVRNSVAELLILEGYDALPVPTADAAWNELAAGLRPALIILDLWLPGMSSGEFVRRLRASPHPRIPVLVLSATPGGHHCEADVDSITQKPIEATTLVRTVDKLVRVSVRTAAPERRPARRMPRPKRTSAGGRRSVS